jgi:hypothetical protein
MDIRKRIGTAALQCICSYEAFGFSGPLNPKGDYLSMLFFRN